MDNSPGHNPAPDDQKPPVDDKKLPVDDDPLPAELQSPFPEVIRQNEKGIYARSISDQAPEAIVLGDDADKEVAHGADALSPQVLEGDSPLYPLHDGSGDGNRDAAEPDAEPDHEAKKSVRRICGLPMATFWIVVLVICVLIVGVAIGAGVGTALAKKPKSNTVSNNTPANTAAP
jgi:hypothetical protein